MSDNSDKMNFKDYYQSLKTKYLDLKKEICDEFEISDKSFYNKMNQVDGNDFDPLQKQFISERTGIAVEILFPIHEQEKVA